MTQPKEQQEPSMEEILSSIRRIIADEASDEESERDAGGSLTEWPPERDADASALDAEDGDADDDVLELTEVVREDAEVIELDRNLAQPHPIEQQLEARPGKPLQAELAPGEQNRASASDEPAALRHSSSAAGGAPAEQPHGDHPAQSPTDIRDDEMEDHQTAMPKNGRESLVSDRAAGAATGAFAKLSQAVQRTPPEVAIADDSGRTVEQFIEDIMRPMLRDWLDENLPPLVERIVQKEIQKIVRRAEDS